MADKSLDCGDLRRGFARIRCENPECRHELLLAFSCRGRYFCPSCHAKRVVAFALWLEEEVLAAVPHRQYVFTIPKLLRVHFRFDRKLLGLLSSAAWESVREMVHAAVPDGSAIPGMAASIQTFGDQGAGWHPHVHASVGPTSKEAICKLPHSSGRNLGRLRHFQLMLLFRHKTVEILDKFRHPGFSVYQGWPIRPQDAGGRAKLAAYILHPPIALDRLAYGPDSGGALYRRKPAPPGFFRHFRLTASPSCPIFPFRAEPGKNQSPIHHWRFANPRLACTMQLPRKALWQVAISAIIVNIMKFEWDAKKAAKNSKKHGVSFQTAATVFGDPLAITFQDPAHSENEDREMTFGMSLQKRLLVVSHTKRKDQTRIISARLMERKEMVIYEEG